MSLQDDARRPGAGRPIPEEEETPSRTSALAPRGRRLTQRTLFQYGTKAARSQQGKSKRSQDYSLTTQESLPWGDYHASGREAKEKGYFRILSHNVNGLSKANHQIDVVDFARTISDKEIGLFGIQETNRNFERAHMLDSFHNVIKGISTHHQGAVSSARLSWQADYQPGGTAVSVRNKWASRYLSKGSDDMGRWSWITLTGQGTTKITFISGYRVCDGASASDITSKTVRSQQEWMYADKGLPQVNLRKQFVTDIIALIKGLQKSGNEIVLMMDANEPCGSGSASDAISLACGLRDAHSLATDATQAPATHNRGSEKIDFVLISPRTALSVRAASILPFQDGYLSDHRALIVDFHASTLFAAATSEIVAPPSRNLTSTNPAAVEAYVKHMLQHIDHHRIEERVEWLMKRSSEGNWGHDEELEWERVDWSLVQARTAAEAKCPKKRSGKYPWSPDFDLAGKRLLYWRSRMREFTARKTNHTALDKLAAALELKENDTQHKPASEVYTQIQKARQQLRQVKTQSTELREDHLVETAKFAASLHNMATASAISAIRAREKSSRQFRQLRSILRTSTSAGLERIDVPNDQAVLRQNEQVPRIQLVTKEEIEEVLVPHTERRFTQHQETPFGHGYRQRSFGVDCTSTDASALRTGTYDYKLIQLTDEARQWLSDLRTKDFAQHESGLILCNITTQDVIDGWSKMRESTSSAPGGHYGHYKTASVVARLPEDHPQYTRRLAEIYAKTWTLPLKHGFAPQRWSHCIDAILEKIPGKPIIEKLRIIMLYEADFNFILKLIWGKRLVKNAEKYGCLGKSNHGSRKGRQATDAQLEKLLLYDITRLTRTSLVTVDNDAKSCYDRILKPLSMTACIAVGLPLCAATMHNLTHHRMVHRIKSRHGLLRPYSGTDDNAHEGTGQGSGASPAIWLIYMVTLLNAFAKFSPGMHVTSPYQALSVVILAVFFVDDGMPGVNDALEQMARPLAELINCAERITQAWERLLFVSGGALELTKCFAYVVYWDLSGGTHRMLRPDEIPGCSLKGDRNIGPISLTYGDKSETRFPLDTVSPWIGRRTLGVRIAPAGTWSDEFKHRRAQARELSLLIAGSVLSPDTARLGYHMMVCPKIEYPLTVTQFTQRECDSISASVIRACLSSMGYNCNMPREVVYGPISLFGLGIHDLYIEQGIKQVSALVGHLRQDSDTGRMMQIEMQWCQVQAGTNSLLLENTATPIDYIETCWIMGIRDFLRTYDLKIDLTDDSSPHATQRFGDEFIMDALLSRGDCTATELQRLNACRLFLQVARISDIATIDGKKIRDGPLKGVNDGIFMSVTKWPRQGRPPKQWWTLWKNKLKRVFSSDGTSNTLRTKLGAWNEAIKIDEWPVTTTTINGKTEVYERRSTGEYKRTADTTDTRKSVHSIVHAHNHDYVDSLPVGAVPAELGRVGKNNMRRVYTAPTSTGEHQVPIEEPVASFDQFIREQPHHIRQLMQDVDATEDTMRNIATLITTCPTLQAGTDGGLAVDSGTFGYAWSDGNTIYASGKGHTTGSGASMSSTRAELSGILAALTYIRLVVDYTNVEPMQGLTCLVHCDSRAALQRVQSFVYEGFGTSWRCRANYDLEVAIKVCIKSLPFTVTWKWVRGHASRRKKSENFTWPETLNSHADAMATEARSTKFSPCNHHWPEQTVSVIGPQGRITGHLAKELRHCCTSRDLFSYWKERYNWTAAQAATVDILATKSIASKLSAASARRIQKLRCGWLPVNSREARHDPDQPSGCAACTPTGIIPETVDHIFQCCATSRRKAVTTAFSLFYPKLREFKTSTCIIGALQTGATAWIEDKEPPPVALLKLPNNTIGRLTARAYEEQSQLGWNVLFRGFWSHSWRLAQEEQFRTQLTREMQDTGERWSVRVQMWFIDLFESLWTLRNEDQHGKDVDTERIIRVSKCERAIRRLYDKGEKMPYWERHPFRAPIEQLLSKPVTDQELWILQTERYLPKALRRIKNRGRDMQHAMTKFFPRRT